MIRIFTSSLRISKENCPKCSEQTPFIYEGLKKFKIEEKDIPYDIGMLKTSLCIQIQLVTKRVKAKENAYMTHIFV